MASKTEKWPVITGYWLLFVVLPPKIIFWNTPSLDDCLSPISILMTTNLLMIIDDLACKLKLCVLSWGKNTSGLLEIN